MLGGAKLNGVSEERIQGLTKESTIVKLLRFRKMWCNPWEKLKSRSKGILFEKEDKYINCRALKNLRLCLRQVQLGWFVIPKNENTIKLEIFYIFHIFQQFL